MGTGLIDTAYNALTGVCRPPHVAPNHASYKSGDLYLMEQHSEADEAFQMAQGLKPATGCARSINSSPTPSYGVMCPARPLLSLVAIGLRRAVK